MKFPGFGRQEPETHVDPVTGVVVTSAPHTLAPRTDLTADEKARAEQRRIEAAEKARREGYQTGRKDAAIAAKAAPRRHGHPVLATLVVLVALVGALWLALAVREGSFTDAGKVVDAKVAEVASPARDAARTAAERSGQAVANAGQAIEQQGEKIRQSVD